MFDVCPRVRAYEQISELRPYGATNRALSRGWTTLRGRFRPIGGSSFEYQNPFKIHTGCRVRRKRKRLTSNGSIESDAAVGHRSHPKPVSPRHFR